MHDRATMLCRASSDERAAAAAMRARRSKLPGLQRLLQVGGCMSACKSYAKAVTMGSSGFVVDAGSGWPACLRSQYESRIAPAALAAVPAQVRAGRAACCAHDASACLCIIPAMDSGKVCLLALPLGLSLPVAGLSCCCFCALNSCSACFGCGSLPAVLALLASSCASLQASCMDSKLPMIIQLGLTLGRQTGCHARSCSRMIFNWHASASC